MLLADSAQGVFQRGFDPATLDETWTRCELADNCRNTFGIASILHRHLDGATPLAGPESLCVRWREAGDDDTAVELVGEEIDHIEAEGYETPRVLVATRRAGCATASERPWASARGNNPESTRSCARPCTA